MQGQFVIETYFVMVIYGLIVLGTILLTEAASHEGGASSRNKAGKRRMFAIVGLFLLAFFFSLILSIFRSKAGGYPYSFLLK